MKRVETYVGMQVYEWLFSAQAQNDMVGLSKLSAAVLGTGVLANGLACGPTSPATMTVQVGPGELYSMQALEATACGTLPAQTGLQILKQGIQLGTFTTGTLAAPLTTGQSINYLIEAQYQDSDISIDPTSGNSPVVLQYYNAANSAVPWAGPNDSGSTSNTFRDGIIAYQIKAGTAATTGSQVTPTPDAGWTGLWVVSVPFAAATLTAGNINSYSAAPILPSGLLQSLISGNLTYGIDNGSANVIQATYPVPITSLVDNMELWVKVKTANTGATTFTPNPGVIAASPVVGAAHAALQGGEYIASGRALHVWRADISSWVLVECTGAAVQIAPATASQHAMQLGQAVGRLINVQVFTSSGTYTPTAGTNSIIARAVGGGGGSGGTPATSSVQNSLSQNGASGAYAEARFTTGFTGGLAVTIGAAGAAGAAAGNGGTGGTTSLASLIVCPGGTQGSAGGLTANPVVTASAAPTAAPTISGAAEIIASLPGAGGSPGFTVNVASSQIVGGNGGSNPLGNGGVTGSPGLGKGAGAGGVTAGISSAALAGQAGTTGAVIVYEFA